MLERITILKIDEIGLLGFVLILFCLVIVLLLVNISGEIAYPQPPSHFKKRLYICTCMPVPERSLSWMETSFNCLNKMNNWSRK